MLKKNKVYLGDCLEVMKKIDAKSIDMILCDLPYGTTTCKWDVIIPFEPLWKQYKRIVKDNAVIAIFGNEPFSSFLRLSNLKMYRYDWIWHKNKSGNIFQYKMKPMNRNETISIFTKHPLTYQYSKINKYYPELVDCNRIVKTIRPKKGRSIQRFPNHSYNLKSYSMKKTGYPESVIYFKCDKSKLHPTQKPVKLFKYLIKTYTNKDELVLDNCAGSGTTGKACQNLKRNFILIEKEKKYYEIIKKRLFKDG